MDLCAYLELMASDDATTDGAFKRVVNVPKRQIGMVCGAASLATVCNMASECRHVLQRYKRLQIRRGFL